MKVAVRYYTKTGNTKRLAESIAAVCGVEAKPISVPVNEEVDVLFLGNSYYAFNIDPEVRDFVAGLDKSKVGKDEIVRDGGVVTLIGPAGVGKTTTIAKLAARFVMKYGPDRVALITADHYRIGAVEQVKTYGRIMGCSTFAIKSLEELPEMLYTLRDKSLVLVDTVGVGLHDERFSTQLSQLKKFSKLNLKNYLVLPATAQRKVLEHAYEHFSSLGLRGVILTKVDETQSLADALSLCIKENLNLSYVTNGQRVPEDISIPDARDLTLKALSSVENDVAKYALDQKVS